MLIDTLNWRYATKRMDPSHAVPEEKVDRILEAARLAPTSSGLQPFEIFVVTNPDLREKLRAAAFDQAQLIDGSHVLVFAAWTNYSEARIDEIVEMSAEARGPSDALSGYYERLKGMYLPREAGVNHDHAARQAYIAFAMAIAQAAEEEVDATPMEGFEADKVDEILNLKARGLHAVTILPLGYRAAEGDWLKGLAKVRRPMDQLVTRLD